MDIAKARAIVGSHGAYAIQDTRRGLVFCLPEQDGIGRLKRLRRKMPAAWEMSARYDWGMDCLHVYVGPRPDRIHAPMPEPIPPRGMGLAPMPRIAPFSFNAVLPAEQGGVGPRDVYVPDGWQPVRPPREG